MAWKRYKPEEIVAKANCNVRYWGDSVAKLRRLTCCATFESICGLGRIIVARKYTPAHQYCASDVQK